MFAQEARKTHQAAAAESVLDPKLRSLLDHVAAELAEEYIRLMEGAAQTEGGGPEADSDPVEGDPR
jgi:hypothetical protein